MLQTFILDRSFVMFQAQAVEACNTADTLLQENGVTLTHT